MRLPASLLANEMEANLPFSCPYTKERDASVTKAAKEAGVEVITKLGHTLFWAGDIVKANKGHPPLAYGAFCKIAEKQPEPAKPLPAPPSLPNPGTTDLKGFTKKSQGLDRYEGIDNNAPSREADDQSYETYAGPDGAFSVPSMEELGMQPATSPHRGGETRALQVLEDYLKNEAAVAAFEKPKTECVAFFIRCGNFDATPSPSAFSPAASPLLLCAGLCIICRGRSYSYYPLASPQVRLPLYSRVLSSSQGDPGEASEAQSTSGLPHRSTVVRLRPSR